MKKSQRKIAIVTMALALVALLWVAVAVQAQTPSCCGSEACKAKAVDVAQACGSGCTKPCCAEKKSCCPSAAAQDSAQTTCPIMGLPINKKLSIDYEGQKVYFCCPGCIAKFKEDPAKDMDKLPQFN